MTKEDTYLSYEEEDMDRYENLKNKTTSPFYRQTYADIFLFAVCIARVKNIPGKKIKTKKPNIPLSVLKNKKWLFYAIGIADTKSHKAIFDEESILNKMEELANSGIKFLHKMVFKEAGDPFKKIELLNQELS